MTLNYQNALSYTGGLTQSRTTGLTQDGGGGSNVYVTLRAPTSSDNEAAGYAVGMLWQYNGTVWEYSGGGVWTEISVGIYPADEASVAPIFARGSIKLANAYSGPAMGMISGTAKTITGITQADPAVVTSAGHGFTNGQTVFITAVVGMTQVNTRAYKAANVTTDTFELTTVEGVNVNSTGFTAYSSGGSAFLIANVNLSSQSLSYGTRDILTTSAIETAQGGSTGTYGVYYDQVGIYHITNGLTNRFDYYPVTEKEVAAFVCNGPQQNSRRMANPLTPITNIRNYTSIMAMRMFFGANSGSIYELGEPTANRQTQARLTVASGIEFASFAGITSTQVFSYRSNGATDRRVRQNGKEKTITNSLTSIGATGDALGNSVGDTTAGGLTVVAQMGWNSTLSDTDRKKVEASLAKALNIYPQVIDSIVIHGDSLEQGNTLQSGTTGTSVWTSQVQSLITKPYRYQNLGRGGANAATLDTDAATLYANAYTSGAEHILIFGGGTNSLAAHVAVADVKTSLLSMAAKGKAAGFTKCYWKPVFPRTTGMTGGQTNADFETDRLQLYTDMVASIGGDLDGVIAMPDSVWLLTNWSGNTFDNVHMTSAANLIIAQTIADYINARHI